MRHSSIILLLLFTLSGCKSVDKLYESGDYEQVISKLDGKAKRNSLDRRERTLMVRAANKYFETETEKALASSNSPNYKDWKNARQKLKRLSKDANKILAYPQIRESELETNEIDALSQKVDQKLFDYTWDLYDAEIEDYYKTGDREYTMRAHRHVHDLGKYGADDLLMDSLYEHAVYLGHRFIAVDFDSDVFNSWEFRNEFQNEIDFRNDEFHTFTDRVGQETDYEIVIGAEIYDKDEDRDNSYQDYSERIVDYYETVVDTSTNQQIEKPVYKRVEATVKTIEYVWTVEGRMEYTIYDIKNNKRFDSGSYRTRVEDRELFHFLHDGDADAVPSNINLETFEIRSYDFDDLVEACFEALAEEFNDRVDIKNKLL